MTTVHLQYFSTLRSQVGLGEETVVTAARTPEELWGELETRHRWNARRAHCAVAVNDDFAAWDSPLSDQDRVVFITPVAGG